jgi:hypothetical protein
MSQKNILRELNHKKYIHLSSKTVNCNNKKKKKKKKNKVLKFY